MYQIGRVAAPLCEAQTDRFLHTFAQLFVSRSWRRLRRARSSSCGEASIARRNGLLVGRRQRPGSEAQARDVAARARRRSAISARALAELERPDRVGGVHVHGAVACDARRPRVARDRGADDVRPALDELGHARPAGRSGASSARISLPSGSMLHLHELRGLDRQRRRVRRGDHRLPHARDALGQHARGGRGRAPRARRRAAGAAASAAAPPRRAAARARRAAARPASRTGAGRGRRSRPARRRGAGRARSCRARGRARGAPRGRAAVGGSAS